MASRTEYSANNLNQYTAEGSFCPEFDADGNQTLIRTSTGIWNVTYNAKNRPVRFEKADGSIVVECTYKAPEGLEGDWTNTQCLPRRGECPMRWARINTMGRRATKKVTTNGTLTEHRRYLYRGYLQIDSPPPRRRLTPAGQSRFAHCPTGLTAVGRLACCDLAYPYTPYGEVSPAPSYDQPLRWSSEYHDIERGLHHYNYRHYNPAMGRWISRDPLGEGSGTLLFKFILNNPLISYDERGLFVTIKRSVADCTITVIHNIVLYSSEQYPVDLQKLEVISMLITSSIEIYWNGFMKDCCTVIFDPNVSILPYKPSWVRRWSNLTSYIEITNKTDHTSFVTNGKNGTWRAEADPWVYAHESGHIAGLPDDYVDQYTVDPNTNKITRVSVPKNGHEGHMMGGHLGRAQQHEVDKILESVSCPCNNKES